VGGNVLVRIQGRENILVNSSSVKLIKSYVECCFADFYYDSKVTVTKNIE